MDTERTGKLCTGIAYWSGDNFKLRTRVSIETSLLTTYGEHSSRDPSIHCSEAAAAESWLRRSITAQNHEHWRSLCVKLHLRDGRTNGQTPGVDFGTF